MLPLCQSSTFKLSTCCFICCCISAWYFFCIAVTPDSTDGTLGVTLSAASVGTLVGVLCDTLGADDGNLWTSSDAVSSFLKVDFVPGLSDNSDLRQSEKTQKIWQKHPIISAGIITRQLSLSENMLCNNGRMITLCYVRHTLNNWMNE